MKDLLLGRIKEFKETQSELKDLVKHYVQNKDFPLDERWEVFAESDLGDHDSYYIRFESIDLMDICDRNRYETIDVIYQVDNLIETYEYYLDKDEYELDFNLEEINALKEEVLEKFVKSFECDW